MPTSSNRLDRIRSIVEIAANLTLVVALIVGVTMWLRLPKGAGVSRGTDISGNSSHAPALGTQIVLPGVDWSPHKATLVLAISSVCHFCIESTPFYSEITHSAHVSPIIVVMPQGDQYAREFLQKHDITPSGVVSANLMKIQVNATPTILLISPAGIVTNEWVGELTAIEKEEVIGFLNAPEQRGL